MCASTFKMRYVYFFQFVCYNASHVDQLNDYLKKIFQDINNNNYQRFVFLFMLSKFLYMLDLTFLIDIFYAVVIQN